MYIITFLTGLGIFMVSLFETNWLLFFIGLVIMVVGFVGELVKKKH